jgi:hypothetical protein
MVMLERLQADSRALQAFAWLNPGHVQVISQAPDLRHYRVRLNLDAPVASRSGYEVLAEHDVLVDIPDNYLARDHSGSFVKSRIRREGKPVFHPNSWQHDGALCYDATFTPGKSLAEQLHDAISLMQCRLINHDSPASWDVDWAFRQHGGDIKARVHQVALRLPRSDLRSNVRELPRVIQ